MANSRRHKKDFQLVFLKLTAKHILNWLSENDKHLHSQLQVNDKDRGYQVWERNSLSIDIYNQPVFVQKMTYIHNNPLQPKWQLCSTPAEYRYSSAKFYKNGFDEFEFLTLQRIAICCWSGDQQWLQQKSTSASKTTTS